MTTRIVRISELAVRDIEEVLAWTLREFGDRQYESYRGLIADALREISKKPEDARPRPEIHPEARVFHIGRRGHRARHLFLLRIASDGAVEVARLLYDGVDFVRHVPMEWGMDR